MRRILRKIHHRKKPRRNLYNRLEQKVTKIKEKLIATIEVFVMTFIGVPLITLCIYTLYPKFEAWQTDTAGFVFPVFVNVVMVGLSLAAILLRGKKLIDYGIIFRPLKYHLDITATCFIPVVLAGFPLGVGVDHTSWGGALILAASQVGLLFLLARVLSKKPSVPTLSIIAAGMFLISPKASAGSLTAWKAIAIFLTYALFVGFGEEIIYRGYMQSRLNEAFGKPYRFFGVAFGWGAILTALFFGLTHVGLLRWMLGMSNQVTWAWGLWTIFGGLVFSYVREKSGSILAPALLHGLPQAIATVAMLFL